MAPSSHQLYNLCLDNHLELISIKSLRLEDEANKSLKLSTSSRKLFGDAGGSQRDLCLMFGWFGGERRHLMKYARLYLDQGFDVLLVKNRTKEMFTALSSMKAITSQILIFLCQNKHYDQIVVHGFSIGAILWGKTLCLIEENSSKFAFLREKIKCQVWDSPFTDPKGLGNMGSSIAFPDNPVLKKLTGIILTAYAKVLRISKPHDPMRLLHAFQAKNLKVPYLLYTSEDDTVAEVSMVARCADAWQGNGSVVHWKSWKNSQHVCHMKNYPQEYETVLRMFLSDSLSLNNNNTAQTPKQDN